MVPLRQVNSFHQSEEDPFLVLLFPEAYPE